MHQSTMYTVTQCLLALVVAGVSAAPVAQLGGLGALPLDIPAVGLPVLGLGGNNNNDKRPSANLEKAYRTKNKSSKSTKHKQSSKNRKGAYRTRVTEAKDDDGPLGALPLKLSDVSSPLGGLGGLPGLPDVTGLVPAGLPLSMPKLPVGLDSLGGLAGVTNALPLGILGRSNDDTSSYTTASVIEKNITNEESLARLARTRRRISLNALSVSRRDNKKRESPFQFHCSISLILAFAGLARRAHWLHREP